MCVLSSPMNWMAVVSTQNGFFPLVTTLSLYVKFLFGISKYLKNPVILNSVHASSHSPVHAPLTWQGKVGCRRGPPHQA